MFAQFGTGAMDEGFKTMADEYQVFKPSSIVPTFKQKLIQSVSSVCSAASQELYNENILSRN